MDVGSEFVVLIVGCYVDLEGVIGVGGEEGEGVEGGGVDDVDGNVVVVIELGDV